MHASEFLKEGLSVLGERASDRDVEEERSMTKVVELFNLLHGTELTVVQGWNFMVMLKMVRAHTGGKFRKDDYVDQANYIALEGEAKSQEKMGVIPSYDLQGKAFPLNIDQNQPYTINELFDMGFRMGKIEDMKP